MTRRRYITDGQLDRDALDEALSPLAGENGLPEWESAPAVEAAPSVPAPPMPGLAENDPEPGPSAIEGVRRAAGQYMPPPQNHQPSSGQDAENMLRRAQETDMLGDLIRSFGGGDYRPQTTARDNTQALLQNQARQDQQQAQRRAQRQAQEANSQRRNFWTQAMRDSGIDPAQYGNISPDDARDLVQARNRHTYRLGEIDARGDNSLEAQRERDRAAGERNRLDNETRRYVADSRRRRAGGGGAAGAGPQAAPPEHLVTRIIHARGQDQNDPAARADALATIQNMDPDKIEEIFLRSDIGVAAAEERGLTAPQAAAGVARNERDTRSLTASVNAGENATRAIHGMSANDVRGVAQGLSLSGNPQALSQFYAENPTANRNAIGAVGTYLSARLRAQSGLTASEQEVKRLLSQMQAGQAVDPQAFVDSLHRLLEEDRQALARANATGDAYRNPTRRRAPTSAEGGGAAPAAAAPSANAPAPTANWQPDPGRVQALAAARGWDEERARRALINAHNAGRDY